MWGLLASLDRSGLELPSRAGVGLLQRSIKEIDDLVNEVNRGLVKQGHEDGITPAIGHPLEGLTRGTTTNLGQELSAIRIQIAEVPLMGSQLAEKRQFGHLALDEARALARSNPARAT